MSDRRIIERRHEHDARVQFRADADRRRYAVHGAAQPHVHQNQVRPVLVSEASGVLRVGRLSNRSGPKLVQQSLVFVGNHQLVLDDQHAQLLPVVRRLRVSVSCRHFGYCGFATKEFCKARFGAIHPGFDRTNFAAADERGFLI
jgi:hypothetical protein